MPMAPPAKANTYQSTNAPLNGPSVGPTCDIDPSAPSIPPTTTIATTDTTTRDVERDYYEDQLQFVRIGADREPISDTFEQLLRVADYIGGCNTWTLTLEQEMLLMEQRRCFTQSETEGVWGREKRLAIRTCIGPR